MRTLEKVLIRSTERSASLAQKALDIQDAVNPLAVAEYLQCVQEYFRSDSSDQQRYGSDIGIQNPISLAVLNKLNDLAGLDQTRTECFDACHKLAKGEDVEWEIYFLN